MYTNRRAPKVATFPDFSIRILRGTRELMSVIYESGARSITFEGELVGPNWKQINLLMPADFPPADRARLVKRLAEGMAHLGYEYRIFSRGPAEAVPEEERQAAIAEMRALGWEPQVSANGATIEMRRVDGAPSLAHDDALARSQRFAALLLAIHGTRHKFEDLARSPSAID